MYIKAQTGVGSANTPTPEKSNAQRINDKQRRQTSSRVLTALSGKQKEPNRGQGTERHPSSPRAHVTGPTTEEAAMFSNIDEGVKDKISPHDAGEILNAHGGHDADFHQLSSHHVEGLLGHAKRVGYHKSKHAPGSRARMFHQFLKHHASSVHEEVIETPHMIFDAPEVVDEGRESEYTANQHLSSSSSRRKPGHYLMKNGRPLHAEPHKSSADALGAYKRIGNTAGISIHHVKENDEVVPGSVKTLAELKKTTLGSYIKKASESGAEHMADVQHWVSQANGGHKMADRADKAYTKRQSGIAKAVGRLTKEGVESHEHLKDHTKNPYHATLVGHGFVHQETHHKQNHLNRDPKHDFTEHRYSHPSHGKSHVVVTQYHDASLKKNHTFLHRHEQSNGIIAPAHGDNKEQLHRSLSREYGVPKGMKPPKVMAWEKHDPPKYKMHEAIQNPNSSGQGHDPEHENHPLHATIVKHGYKYSHSTPIRALDGSTYIHHTYKHGEHNVGVHHSNIWNSSTSTSSGRHHSGKGAAELEAHLKSKGRRYGLKKEDAPAMSAGGAGDPGKVQNPTDNYASQLSRRKIHISNYARRHKPVEE